MAAAVEADDALVIACSQPADRDRGRTGEILVLRVTQGEREILGRLGPVGAESRGVEIATLDERVVVGWRDADVFTARARLADLAGESRPLSPAEVVASAPSLLFHDGALVTAWTESWVDGDGEPTGRLVVQREGEPPRPSLEVGDFDVRVGLSADESGLMVALRDRRPRGAVPRAFVGRLDDKLRLHLSALRSPSRADDEQAHPRVIACGPHHFSLASRTSSRGVTMVTLRRLDESLQAVGREHQIYEYHARFPHAVATCLEERLLIGVAERPTAASPRPRLSTYGLRCGPGIRHERTPPAR